MMRLLVPAASLLTLFVLTGTVALGQEGIVWDDPLVVDTGVASVSTSGAGWFGDNLWVFYEKNGDIYGAVYGSAGWGRPRRFTTDPARQSEPRAGGNKVIWEDWRGGVPEVWKANFDGTSWSDESILSTDDGVPSRHGVITTSGLTSWDMAAWEDSLPNGFRVQVRRCSGDYWFSPEPVTPDTSGQRDPAVGKGGVPYWWAIDVVWADFRNGEPEIYTRSFNGESWGPEAGVTDLPGECRHPSVIVEDYSDGMPGASLAFESTESSGVVETYARPLFGPVQRISPDDGIPSTSSSSASFSYGIQGCGSMPVSSPRHYVTWTDLTLPRTHQVWGPTVIDPAPVQGVSTSILAAHHLGYSPADLVEAWIESQDGIPTLVSRVGHTEGCWDPRIEAPSPSLLVGPEGMPATVVHVHNACGGYPMPDVWLEVRLSSDLIGKLTWDPAHLPQSVFYVPTDDSGEARIPLYGGGCSQDGAATIDCPLGQSYDLQGAKSPDVNGDCIVGEDDLEYVRSQLGTSDFCADLDMSGTVGPEDVAIVEETLWDHCSDITAVPEAGASGEPALFAIPNPARESVRFRLLGLGAAASQISIHDASGRLVRTLAVRGGAPFVSWDLRDAMGLRLGGGMYFAVARAEGWRVSTPVLVVR